MYFWNSSVSTCDQNPLLGGMGEGSPPLVLFPPLGLRPSLPTPKGSGGSVRVCSAVCTARPAVLLGPGELGAQPAGSLQEDLTSSEPTALLHPKSSPLSQITRWAPAVSFNVTGTKARSPPSGTSLPNASTAMSAVS